MASKKIQKNLQNIGLSQDVSNDLCSIQVNGNYSRIVHCKFCSLGHIVTNCPRRYELKLHAYEYQLLTSSEQDMNHLRQRVRSSNIPKMGIVLHQSQIFGVIPSFIVFKTLVLTLLMLTRTDFIVLDFCSEMVKKNILEQQINYGKGLESINNSQEQYQEICV